VLANSQKNPAWKSIKLGTCNDTIGQSGCYITALGILADKTPPEVNQILKDNGGYTNGCLVNAARAAELLGLEYNGITKEYQNEVCIAETDHYKSSGVPQHFFVWLGRASRIIDTLTGLEMDNPYHIVSFRLFKPKGTIMSDDQFKEIAWHAVNGFYLYFCGFQATDHKINNQVNWIMGRLERKYAISDWYIAQLKEKDFTDKWIFRTECNSLIAKAKDECIYEPCPPCPEIAPYSENVCRTKFPCPEPQVKVVEMCQNKPATFWEKLKFLLK